MTHYDPKILPKVSLLILTRQDEWDLNLTLQSALSQQYHDVEILIACAFSCPEKCKWNLPETLNHDVRIFSFGDIPENALLDTSLTLLRGVYVQILFPGFVYLSPYVLEQMMIQALKQQCPALIYTASLSSDPSPFQKLLFQPFSKDTLRLGKTPAHLSCCFIRRDLLSKLGKWALGPPDEYDWRFFYHLSLLESLHTYGLKRVVMENASVHKQPKSDNCWSTCLRIFKTFGPLAALRYLKRVTLNRPLE